MALTTYAPRPAPRVRNGSGSLTKAPINGVVNGTSNGATHLPSAYAAPLPPPELPRTGRTVTGPAGPSMAKRLLLVVLVGMVLGGLTGLLVGAVSSQTWTASALVQLASTPDPGLSAVGSGPSSDSAVTDFTSAEIAWLSGTALTDTVQQRLDLDRTPEISVARVGLSSVVKFSGQATSAVAALRVTQTAVDVYTQRRTDSVRKTVADALTSVNRTISDVQAQDPSIPRTNADGTDRLSKLYELRGNLLLLQNSKASPAPVLQPTTLDKPGSSPMLVGPVLGAVVGGLLAVLLFAFWRKRTTTIVTTADAGEVVDHLLVPLVDLGPDWRDRVLRMTAEGDRRTARQLAAQLTCAARPAGRVVAVAGQTPDSGSRAVATMMAVGLADRTPTVLGLVGGRPVDHPLGKLPGFPLGSPPGGPPAAGSSAPGNPAPGSPGASVAVAPEIDPVRMGTEVERLELLALSDQASGPGWAVVDKLVQAGTHCIVIDLGPHAHLAQLLPTATEKIVSLGLGLDNRPDAQVLSASILAGRNVLAGVLTRLPWKQRLRRRLERRTGRGA